MTFSEKVKLVLGLNKTKNISNFSVSFQKSKFSSVLASKAPGIPNSQHFAVLHLSRWVLVPIDRDKQGNTVYAFFIILLWLS